MLIENVDDFALWLVNELTGLSDADPEALSKYVIALLKKDKSESSLRKICVDQLHVFLSDKTKKFIDDVFDCLKHKTFMKNSDTQKLFPENSIPKFIDTTIKSEKTQFKVSSSDEELLPDLRKYSPNSKIKSSDDDDRKNSDYRPYSKRTREHSAYKIHDDSRKKKRFNDDIDLKEKRYHSSKHKSHKTKKHVFDRIDYPRKYLDRNEESSKLIDYSNEKRLWNIKTSCPDFVEKGVCLKGDSCEFDHGQDIVRSDINCIYSGASMPLNTTNSRWQPIPSWGDKFAISKPIPNIVDLSSYTQDSNNNQNVSDIYDPSHPEIDGANKNDTKKVKVVHDSAPVYVPSLVENNQKESNPWKESDDNSTNNFEEGSRVTTVIGSGQGRHRYQRMSSPRRGRFNNNNNNNHHNKSNDNRYNRRQGSARCLLLTHIPLECNDEQKLRQHFRAFGRVTDVQVGFQGDQHHALIEFATNENARAAFRSPLPILDNRFIRTSLFARSIDSNNLTLCKDNISDDENRKRRTVIQYSGADNDYDCVSTGDESNQGKWNRKRKVSENEIRSVVINNDHQVSQQLQQHQSKSVESRDNKWPVASDLKLDRRPNDPDPVKPIIKQQSEESKSRQAEAKKDRDRKMQLLNDREEMKNRIDRLEESVQSCKKRLRILLEDQKKPDCDQELIKRQLLESYNYFKELREMLESIKKKFASQPDLSEEEKLKLKIKKLQQELVDSNESEEEHKKQLKQITELKRELVKLQTISKKTVKRPPKLPSIVETKLDNRPKTLYLTGSCLTGSLSDFRHLFKVYQLEKIEFSDNDFLAVKFKTRKEADRVIKELSKSLKDKNLSLSFEKPVPVCDPLDFNTRSVPVETHRGTPSRRDDCASSDEEDESKMN